MKPLIHKRDTSATRIRKILDKVEDLRQHSNTQEL